MFKKEITRFQLTSSCLVLAAAAGYAVPYVAPYHGPPAPLAHDGRVIDTPEVAHAKAVHLATHAAEAAKASPPTTGYEDYEGKYEGNGGYVAGQSLYYGPPAPLAHDGRVVDTPEVAHAKAAHLAAHAEQISKIAHIAPYQKAHWWTSRWRNRGIFFFFFYRISWDIFSRLSRCWRRCLRLIRFCE